MLETLVIINYQAYLNGQSLTQVTPNTSPTGESGCTRHVYMSDEYIIKVGSVGETTMIIAEEDRKHFAETVYVDVNRKWLVQKRIDCQPNPDISMEHRKIIAALILKYSLGDVTWSTWRSRPHNWTVNSQGVPVIYDYDFNGDISRERGYSNKEFVRAANVLAGEE